MGDGRIIVGGVEHSAEEAAALVPVPEVLDVPATPVDELPIPAQLSVAASQQTQNAKDLGWVQINGYPVVLGEEYTIGDYVYYAINNLSYGMVWRIPVANHTPFPILDWTPEAGLGGVSAAPSPIDPVGPTL